MSKKCIKCGYVRDDEIDKDTPDYECPRCGVIYAKAKAVTVVKEKDGKNRNQKTKEQGISTLIDGWHGLNDNSGEKTKNKPIFNKKNISLTVFVLFIVGYVIASPFFTVMKIKTGVIENDSELLSDNIEFPVLRQNLKEQLNANLLENSRNDGLKNNPFSMIGVALASKMVDGFVDSFVTPSTLAGIMRGNPPSMYKKNVQTKKVDLKKSDLFKNARYRYDSMDKFSIWVPNKDGNEIRFILKRDGLSWKLINFVFPT